MSEPAAFQKKAIPVEVEAGMTYDWCACGKSATQPFCDGSHHGTGVEPVPYKAQHDGKAFFCSCKASRKGPLCDGTHKNL